MFDFDIYNKIFFASFFLFCVYEYFFSAREYPSVSGWRVKGIVCFIWAFYVTLYAPFMWEDWTSKVNLLDASAWPLAAQVLLGLFIYEFGIYWWHRSGHAFQPLWRFNHQIHHSAERVDVYGAFYFHPLDIVAFALIWSVALEVIFGISAVAASVVGFITNILAIFQHCNIKTPKWLGYFVMRPEAHAAHHERGVHYRNFGDIPHWDMLFGTFYNPDTWEHDKKAGFYDGSSAEVLRMVVGKDLSKSPKAMDALKSL